MQQYNITMDRLFKFGFSNTAIIDVGSHQNNSRCIHSSITRINETNKNSTIIFNKKISFTLHNELNIKTIHLINEKPNRKTVFELAIENTEILTKSDFGISNKQQIIIKEIDKPVGMFVGEVAPILSGIFSQIFRREVKENRMTYDKFIEMLKNSIIEDTMEYYIHVITSDGKAGFLHLELETMHWNFLRSSPLAIKKRY